MSGSSASGRFGFPKIDPEARKKAIEEPGPTWREYFYYSFLKVWIALGLFIVDIWIAAYWLRPINPLGLALSLAAAIYLEFLLYEYLWARPKVDETAARRARRTWLRPVIYGRWTPEADRLRQGLPITPGYRGPDPREFL
jgi:hypothetical protein